MCNGLDDDCSGKTDEGFADSDGDGTADCIDSDLDGDGLANAVDCSPTSAAIHAGAIEQCDGVDNNCDGSTDEEFASGCKFFLRDKDGDGFGIASDAKCLCVATGEFSALSGGDCDDGNKEIHPGAVESCDAADDDCDGATDPGGSAGCSTFWPDKDADGYGGGGVSASKCLCGAIPGYVPQSGDCDDADFTVHPGASEACDGKDDNCDGKTDPLNSVGCISYFADSDGDGWGAGGGSQCLCTPADGFTASQSGDCADSDKGIHPGSAESCNGQDDNCDGKTDEGLLTHFYADSDGDGFGFGSGSFLCSASALFSATAGGDCNDGATDIYPGATDICDGKDNNCDGSTDENLAVSTFYTDSDGDGYGNAAKSFEFCGLLPGYSANKTDCDDTNANVHPGAKEIVCNQIDDDCSVGDSCDPSNCIPETLADFEGTVTDWMLGPGWNVATWAKNGAKHGLGYGDGTDYPATDNAGSVASYQWLVLPGTATLQLDYLYAPDSAEVQGPDKSTTTDTLILTVGGAQQLNLNPANDYSSLWNAGKTIAVKQEWWGKTLEIRLVFATKTTLHNHGLGFALDNVLTTCQ